MIRPADAADIEVIAGMEQEVFGADAWSVSQVEADVEAPARHLLVAEADDRIVGYAVVSMAGEIADLLRIAVDHSHRRTGVASALLGEVERLAAEAEADRVMLEVADSNARAQGFYRTRGYVEIARRPGYYAGGGDAVIFVRALG